MGDYFKPLRRKVGLVTLVMACIFMAAWVRGMSVSNDLDTTNWTHTSVGVLLENGLSFVHSLSSDGVVEKQLLSENSMRVWVITDELVREIVNIPHWSIVIPLTSLSAWLLLRKPRVAKPSVQKTDQ